MKTLETLTAIRNYLAVVRQVGHTTTMLNGVKKVDSIILTHSQRMAEHIQYDMLPKKKKKKRFVTLEQAPTALRGNNLPLAIDNAALYKLCDHAINEINNLQLEINSLQLKIDTAKKFLA